MAEDYRRRLIPLNRKNVLDSLGMDRTAYPTTRARIKMSAPQMRRWPVFCSQYGNKAEFWVKKGSWRYPCTAFWAVSLRGQHMHIEFDVGDRL